MMKYLISAVIGTLMTLSVQAQLPLNVRTEDHFYKCKIVNRISFTEKVNRPLVLHESSYYGQEGHFANNDGLVASLLKGLEEGKYQAYHPDGWDQSLTYSQVLDRMKEFDQALSMDWGEEESWYEDETATTGEVFERGEEEIWVGDDVMEEDFDDGFEDDWGSDFEDPLAEPLQEGPEEFQVDLASYEEVIHLVEDWIFDKNRSMMVQQPDFFEVIWVDPTGALPEKVLARFKWKDVRNQLDETKWKARFNDASSLSMAQAIDLRLFHSFMISISGNGVRTLWEAEQRRQELVEFEHNLWSL
jgi:hypothetical protein